MQCGICGHRIMASYCNPLTIEYDRSADHIFCATSICLNNQYAVSWHDTETTVNRCDIFWLLSRKPPLAPEHIPQLSGIEMTAGSSQSLLEIHEDLRRTHSSSKLSGSDSLSFLIPFRIFRAIENASGGASTVMARICIMPNPLVGLA